MKMHRIVVSLKMIQTAEELQGMQDQNLNINGVPKPNFSR